MRPLLSRKSLEVLTRLFQFCKVIGEAGRVDEGVSTGVDGGASARASSACSDASGSKKALDSCSDRNESPNLVCEGVVAVSVVIKSTSISSDVAAAHGDLPRAPIESSGEVPGVNLAHSIVSGTTSGT
jgi:hypothetical protein